MLKVFTIAKNLLISLPLFFTNIEVNRITSSPNKHTHALLTSLLYSMTIPSLLFIKDIVLVNSY